MPVLCDKGSPADENQTFLEYLKKAAVLARKNKSMMLLPRAEHIREEEYGQHLEQLISDYQDVIRTGIFTAFRDTSDHQVRHLHFYEKREGQVYFSLQILAAVYFYYKSEDGDELLREKTEEILHGKAEIRISFPKREVVLCSQENPDAEHIEARYLFRLASREVTTEVCGNVSDPLRTYPDLYLSPHGLIDRADIYKGKIVIIGSEDREIGDFHATPLGEMPGLYLMINGINLILEGLQIHQPKWIIRVLIELLVIAVSTLIGVYLPSTVSAPILAGVFFVSFSSFSFWLFSRHCMFMDFWLPVVGTELCRLIADIAEFLKSFSQKKECDQ